MVKSTTTYTCGICGFSTHELAAAEACEAQGVPPADLAVGTFVGVRVHGWWKRPFLDWALTMPQREGERHSPVGRDDEWRPAAEVDGVEPGRNWFLPIWRVLGQFPAPAGLFYHHVGNHRVGAHQLRTYLWTPQHANRERDHEVISWTGSGHLAAPPIPDAMQPVLTQDQEFRFNELVFKLEKSTEFRERVSLL